jgi:hypothetical protein
LLAYVRDGAVDILQEDGATTNVFENGGFTLDPPARQDRQEAPPFDYYARGAEDRASLRAYNDAIDARIEREYRSKPSPFETVNPSEMPFLLSVVRMVSRSANLEREAMQKAASGFSEVADKVRTPLGDAAPFEYNESATGDDVLSMAARGFGESVQADCFYQYERDMDICNALAGMMGSGMRGLALCKQNAFQDYQTCRGF